MGEALPEVGPLPAGQVGQEALEHHRQRLMEAHRVLAGERQRLQAAQDALQREKQEIAQVHEALERRDDELRAVHDHLRQEAEAMALERAQLQQARGQLEQDRDVTNEFRKPGPGLWSRLHPLTRTWRTNDGRTRP